VGREDVFEKFQNLLEDAKKETKAGDCNRIIITGLGGMGKTQIVIEYCYQHKENYSYVLWVHSDSEVSVHASFRGIAALLNLPIANTDEQI
jgi:CO dehydrogenase nickel-insertion accessory protein CooC1